MCEYLMNRELVLLENDSAKSNVNAIHSCNHTIFKLFIRDISFFKQFPYYCIAVVKVRLHWINEEANCNQEIHDSHLLLIR